MEASRYPDDVFWRQSDPEGLHLYKTTSDPALKRLLMINGCRWDLLNENRPFVGSEPMPPGHALYPKGLTREQIEQYVKQHPEDRSAIICDLRSVHGGGTARRPVVGVPYHEAYKEFIGPMSQALREAAALSDDAAFARFLRLRADALLSDDYYASDTAWLELDNPKFDVILAPYETYLDDLLGVKTSYGAAVLIRNEEESRKLAVFQKYVPEIQDALPLTPEDRPSKKGHATPMEVMDSPYRAGDLRHGYQAVADNLPNDPRIHQEKGSKKIFFKNFMDARVEHVILPLARQFMRPRQAGKASGEGYLVATLLHEIAHGLGPAFARQGGKQVDIREAIGATYSALAEANADAVGMFGVKWLADRGALPKERLEEYYVSYVADIFRTLRFGTGEAHGRAENDGVQLSAGTQSARARARCGLALRHRLRAHTRRDGGAVERVAGDRSGRRSRQGGSVVRTLRQDAAGYGQGARERGRRAGGYRSYFFVCGQSAVAGRKGVTAGSIQ